MMIAAHMAGTKGANLKSAEPKSMTPTACSSLCTSFKFFGVQDGWGCFCGDDYGNQGGKAPDGDCNTQCTGDRSIMCGAPFRNSVYAQPSTVLNTTSARLIGVP
jgi:hypothetical protein